MRSTTRVPVLRARADGAESSCVYARRSPISRQGSVPERLPADRLDLAQAASQLACNSDLGVPAVKSKARTQGAPIARVEFPGEC